MTGGQGTMGGGFNMQGGQSGQMMPQQGGMNFGGGQQGEFKGGPGFMGGGQGFQGGQGFMGGGPGFKGGGDFRGGFGGMQQGGDMGGQQMQQQVEQQMQKQMQERMLQDVKRGSADMERGLGMMERRIKSLETRGAVITDSMRKAIQDARSLVDQVKNAKTGEEVQSLPMDSFGDFMQTINEDMQKAEMSTQLPRMIKEANRALKQQQSALKRAQSRSSRIKVDVGSLLGPWQKAVDDVAQAISEAQQNFQAGKTDEAVELLQDKVFGAMDDLGEQQRLFEMVSDMQRMLKGADSEVKQMERRLARLKKSGKDTAEAEALLQEGKGKLAEIKQMLATPGFDSESLVALVEDASGIRMELARDLAELAGERFEEGEGFQIPGLNFKPMQLPQGFSGFVKEKREESGATCRVESLGAEVPGKCEEVEKSFKSSPPSGAPATNSTVPSGTKSITGPQSLKNSLDEISPEMKASIIDSIKRFFSRKSRKK